MANCKYQDKEWLRTQLEAKKRTVDDIAKECGKSYGTIYYHMRKHNLETKHLPDSIIDEKGNRYGEVVVLEMADVPESEHVMWKCKHDDGFTFEARGTALRKGNVTGRQSRPKGETAFRKLYRAYKHGAKKRNLEWKLTKEQFRNMTKEDCHYCGRSPSKSIGKNLNGEYIYNGLDRMNNSIGYTEENVVTCCWGCNHIKGDIDKEDFIAQINKIYEYNHSTSKNLA